MPLSNASRLADFGTGIGTAGAIIQVDNANQRLGVGTTAPTATLGVAGIVSATAFYGDGSNLDGVASAGLGTALSETEFDPLAVIYQTSDTLSVGATITVDPPNATTKVAYTQYADILLEDDADLIIADGDDFIPDILGLSTEGFSFSNANGNGIFDTVYTDNIENAAGRGAPNFPLGITVSGISTLSGNVSIGGTLTYEDVTNVDSVGVVTARSGIKVTGGGLDVTSGLVSLGDNTNADSQLTITNSQGDCIRLRSKSDSNAFKYGIIKQEPYNNNSVGLQIIGSKSDSGYSEIAIGGGIDGGYAATQIDFYTGATTTTTTGTRRLRIGSAGQLGIGGANYGTSGQVLTSQGGSAAPQWASPAGVWVKLASGTSTSGTTHTVTTNLLTSTYFYYKIIFHAKCATGAYGALGIDTTIDGSTWGSSSGSTAYTTSHMGRWGSNAREGNGANQYGYLMHGVSMQTWGGEIDFAGPNLTGIHKRFHFTGWFGNLLGNNPGTVDSTIIRDDEGTGAAITGIRFYQASDPINYLKWSLLGSAI